MLSELNEVKHVEILLVSLPEMLAKVLVLELEQHNYCLDQSAGFIDNSKSMTRWFTGFELLFQKIADFYESFEEVDSPSEFWLVPCLIV